MQPYQIIFEDAEIIIVNKSSGIPTQADKNNTSSLFEILSENRSNLYLIHRLDQRVNGLVIFAKNEKSAKQLGKDFINRNITKKYRAIVANKPLENEAKLIHWLLKDSKKNLSKTFEKAVNDSKKAELIYKVIQSSERYHLLEIELLTGRFHQIRSPAQYLIQCRDAKINSTSPPTTCASCTIRRSTNSLNTATKFNCR